MARPRQAAQFSGARCRWDGLVLLVLGFVVGGLWPPGLAAEPAADSCALFDHRHGQWTSVLTRHVRDGFVDYAGLKQTGRAELDTYLRSISDVCPGHYDTWTRAKKLAFWINAYNAFTVKLVVDEHPVKSIRSIGFLPMAAFRRDFIPMRKLRGKNMSLDDIEHGILRKELGEARIHFAVVCASKSCPALRSEAFRADDIDAQLDAAGRAFLADPSRNRYDAATNTLYLSAIFKWFRGDFERSAGGLDAFVARYLPRDIATKVQRDKPRIQFLGYDWSLNGR